MAAEAATHDTSRRAIRSWLIANGERKAGFGAKDTVSSKASCVLKLAWVAASAAMTERKERNVRPLKR
jgi:hypothetical protein